MPEIRIEWSNHRAGLNLKNVSAIMDSRMDGWMCRELVGWGKDWHPVPRPVPVRMMLSRAGSAWNWSNWRETQSRGYRSAVCGEQGTYLVMVCGELRYLPSQVPTPPSLRHVRVRGGGARCFLRSMHLHSHSSSSSSSPGAGKENGKKYVNPYYYYWAWDWGNSGIREGKTSSRSRQQ